MPECDVPVPGIFHFFSGIGAGIGKKWYRKKVSEPVSEKFGTEKSTGARVEARVVDEAGGGDETRVDAVERKLKEQFRAAHGHI